MPPAYLVRPATTSTPSAKREASESSHFSSGAQSAVEQRNDIPFGLSRPGVLGGEIVEFRRTHDPCEWIATAEFRCILLALVVEHDDAFGAVPRVGSPADCRERRSDQLGERPVVPVLSDGDGFNDDRDEWSHRGQDTPGWVRRFDLGLRRSTTNPHMMIREGGCPCGGYSARRRRGSRGEHQGTDRGVCSATKSGPSRVHRQIEEQLPQDVARFGVDRSRQFVREEPDARPQRCQIRLMPPG